MAAEREFTSRDLSRALSRAFALHVVGRVVEALAIGWLAAAVVLACSALGAGANVSEETWIAAGIAGACAAASVWLEHAPRPREHMRSVDRRMGWNGALVTASDVSTDAGGGALAHALVRSVGSRLSGAGLTRASLPSTPLAIIALLLGAAVWFGARDFAARRLERESATSTAQLDAEQRAALANAARTLGSAAASVDSPAGREADAARRAVARALDSATHTPALDLDQMNELARRLEELLDEKALGETERAALSRALASLNVGAAASGGSLAGAPNSTAKTGSRADSTRGALASGAALGKMGGPDSRPGGSMTGTSARLEPDTAERGVGSLRWWPARHDAVVEAWLASTPIPK